MEPVRLFSLPSLERIVGVAFKQVPLVRVGTPPCETAFRDIVLSIDTTWDAAGALFPPSMVDVGRFG